MTVSLWRVEAPYFIAGFEVTGERVTRVPPVLRRFGGKSIDFARSYCRDHGWRCLIVAPNGSDRTAWQKDKSRKGPSNQKA